MTSATGSSAWDRLMELTADNDAQDSAAGGKKKVFLKLEDGCSHIGIFRGDPYLYYKPFPNPERVESLVAQTGMNAAMKINFLVQEPDGKFNAYIIDGGKRFMKAVAMARSEYGQDCVFKIIQQGNGKKLNIACLFKEKLTDEHLSKIKEVPLRELGRKPNTNLGGSGSQGGGACPF